MTDYPRKQWICSTMDLPGGARVAGPPTMLVSMGMAARDYLWDQGTVLKVGFLAGDQALHDRVMEAASHWFIDGVNLSLEPAGAEERGQIRIAFDPNDGSWSYVGTDCLNARPNQPTMNLGWATMESSQEDFYSVVIHEFGHALGLLHEHNHPDAKINWNRAAVYADLTGPPNNWTPEEIDNNVFARFDESEVIVTSFDEVSVMIYPIPEHWTMDGKSCTPYWQLSEGDAETIRQLYG